MDGILALVKMIAGLAAVLLLIVLTLKYLNPGDKPEMRTFSATDDVTAYELCNLHGYWAGK